MPGVPVRGTGGMNDSTRVRPGLGGLTRERRRICDTTPHTAKPTMPLV